MNQIKLTRLTWLTWCDIRVYAMHSEQQYARNGLTIEILLLSDVIGDSFVERQMLVHWCFGCDLCSIFSTIFEITILFRLLAEYYYNNVLMLFDQRCKYCTTRYWSRPIAIFAVVTIISWLVGIPQNVTPKSCISNILVTQNANIEYFLNRA